MNYLIILPPNEISIEYLGRAIRALSFVGIDRDKVDMCAPKSHIEYFQGMLHDDKILNYDDLLPKYYETLVFFQGPTGDRICYNPDRKQKHNIYIVDRMCTITQQSVNAGANHYPHIDTHTFNKLGPREDNQFYYFPYGYLFRRTSEGATNSFGHRISHQLSQFESRDPCHKVIAIFGGSAAWGMYNHFEETFSFQLEQKLNNHCSCEGSTLRFSVLNFSLCGNVVLNEILSYILFCNKIRPEIIIAHDGANDFAYGQQSDKHLLDCHGITYQPNLETWAQILHKTDYIPLAWPNEHGIVPTINYPRHIVAAYFDRQKQFQSVVNAFNGIFIAGLQPTIFSKKALSPMEKIWIKSFSPREEPFKNFKYLYEKYLRLKPELAVTHFINHHELFHEFGEKHTFFGDTVHMTPDGNIAIANIYFDYIVSSILPGMM